MSYKFVWLPRNTDNAAPTMSELFTLGAGMSARYSNVLSEVFGAEAGALGSVAVFADSDSAEDRRAAPSTSPAGSRPGPSVRDRWASPPGRPDRRRTPMRILFMTGSDTFAAISACSTGRAAITIKYQLYMNDGTILGDMNEVELPAWGNTQINQVFGDFDPMDGGYIVVWTEDRGWHVHLLRLGAGRRDQRPDHHPSPVGCDTIVNPAGGASAPPVFLLAYRSSLASYHRRGARPRPRSRALLPEPRSRSPDTRSVRPDPGPRHPPPAARSSQPDPDTRQPDPTIATHHPRWRDAG